MVSKLKFICNHCSKEYIYKKSFDKHACVNLKKNLNKIEIDRTENWLPVFDFSDDLFFSSSSPKQIIPPGTHTHLDELKKFSDKKKKELKILHLNINSVFNKIDSIHDILDSNSFDIIFINESKLDNTVPDSYLSHNRYALHRRDREFSSGEGNGRHGGGLLIYIRKNYIHSVELCNSVEAMHLSVTYNNTTVNFIACYKSPSFNNADFLEFLDLKVSGVNLNEPLFIIGDLNMDLNSDAGKLLHDFMNDFHLKNFIKEPTRVKSRLFENSTVKTSSTLLDVILHNDNLVSETAVIGCPFSDHKFIVGSIQIDKMKSCQSFIWTRNLSEKNLVTLGNRLALLDFSKMDKYVTSDEKWLFLKEILLSEIDQISPLKKFALKKENKCPWFDLELTKAKNLRDSLYSLFYKSRLAKDWVNYKEARTNFKRLNRIKIKDYFENKGTKDFKNSKKFWQFYRSSIKLLSYKVRSDGTNFLVHEENPVTAPEKIVEIFNNFFTSIESISISNKDENVDFIQNHFNDLKKKKILINDLDGFSFKRVTISEVEKLFNNLSPSSSPGTSGIHPKILKLVPHILIPVFTKLFNFCLISNSIPEEWKSAVVTPLYKNKGSRSDPNNYRGISVLSPVSKVFEKLLSSQISDYFNNKNLFYSGQHGFRSNHSCETALHELLSDINNGKDKKLISLLLFIDFRKAFDTVDSNLLLTKLFHYGFDTSSLKLIANYFSNRSQYTKLGNIKSSRQCVSLGVPQGSILGPLFFLIFINDLPFFLNGVKSKLFADDTTLYHQGNDLDLLISDFTKKVSPLFDWCGKNRIDINWSKTFCMFITNKRVLLPTHIELNGFKIDSVEKFKLLGITIDNKLNFKSHVASLCLIINSKLFSISRLFNLCSSVKIQFFKTFILPYFDYCISLFVYFSKEALQKLCNKYYLCLFKLFNVELCNFSNLTDINNYLNSKFNINSFQSRIFTRISIFSYKILRFFNSPIILKEKFNSLFVNRSVNSLAPNQNDIRTLRNNKIIITSLVEASRFEKCTFNYLSSKIIDVIGADYFTQSLLKFKKFIYENVNNLVDSFCKNFLKLNLTFKNFTWTKLIN